MTEIIIPSAIVTFYSSIVTEVLKYIPWFRKSDFRKAFLAFIVSTCGTGFYVWTSSEIPKGDFWTMLFLVLVASYPIYKGIVQPLTKKAGLRSQKEPQ